MRFFERLQNAWICLFGKRYVLMEYGNRSTCSAYSNRMNVSKREELAIFASCDGQILDGYKIKVTFEKID